MIETKKRDQKTLQLQKKSYSGGQIFWLIKCRQLKEQAKTQKEGLENQKIRPNETIFFSQCFIKKIIQLLSST